WATGSPTPEFNFAAIPVVESRHPLWDQQPLPVSESGADDATRALGTAGALERATPLTTGLRAEPEATMEIPEETALPFVVAAGIALLFAGLLFTTEVAAATGVVLGAIAVLWWTWRTGEH
ncbi:MAG TPA: hypothetical protein VFC99_13775, partial [Acidimicrobiia bacterium]|nr:hypothetical protein [Acidimicrobiia bacterium]